MKIIVRQIIKSKQTRFSKNPLSGLPSQKQSSSLKRQMPLTVRGRRFCGKKISLVAQFSAKSIKANSILYLKKGRTKKLYSYNLPNIKIWSSVKQRSRVSAIECPNYLDLSFCRSYKIISALIFFLLF